MSTESKFRSLGARKAPEPLTISNLVAFAERVIRTDKGAALRAQNSVADLAAPSNDSKPAPRISSLNELCGKTGAVKISSEPSSEDKDEESDKLITFGLLRRDS